MKRYPLIRRESIPAYVAVMTAWAVISVASAGALAGTIASVPFVLALLWAGVTVMLGMAIMFGASVINLRKLSPGFERLAQGQKDPGIPPVWCPVLTAATNAAMELQQTLHNQSPNR